MFFEKYANLSQRGPRADRIDATTQPGTDVVAGHPFRNSNESSVEADLEELQTAPAHPPDDFELAIEKGMQRGGNCYNALVAGIIN